MTSSLGHLPGDRWEFDGAVVDVFDDMLARSIPDYPTMRSVVTDFAAATATTGAVLDIGCSNGAALAALLDRRPDLTGIGVEVAPPMLAAARARFGEGGRVEVLEHDLRRPLPDRVDRLGAVLAVLTVQFTPIEYRPSLLGELCARLAPGAPLLLVEKVMGLSYRVDRLMTERYLEMKRRHGYTVEEVERKRLALEGVLVPVTAKWNEDMLTGAGFRLVECIWRANNFAAWLALKS